MRSNTSESSGTAAVPNVSNGLLSRPWFYFVLALGWSWLFWLTAALLGLSMETPAGGILSILGLFGPFVAGVTGTYATYGKEGRRDYWRRVIDFKRIGLKWFVPVLLMAPAVAALAVLLGGEAAWGPSALEIWAAPWRIIPWALSIILVGPMEEFGWRGYILGRLQERWNALASSLLLGVIWSVWHLPLFFIPDSYQQGLGVGSAAFWLFLAGIVPLNVAFTWIFNNTGRSTLAAMILHFMINATGEMVEWPIQTEAIYIGLWFLTAIVLTVGWGPKSLRRRSVA